MPRSTTETRPETIYTVQSCRYPSSRIPRTISWPVAIHDYSRETRFTWACALDAERIWLQLDFKLLETQLRESLKPTLKERPDLSF